MASDEVNGEPKSKYFWVNGIVSSRDFKPYIQFSNEDGMLAQMSMSEARQVAMDMLIMASRTEMDAMILQFCKDKGLGQQTGAIFMDDFREYRAAYDREQAERPPEQEGGLPPRVM